MQRRLGLIIGGCGIIFMAAPIGLVLRDQGFILFVAGAILLLGGVFLAIEAVANKKG